ncbi:MAG: DNA polymerase IV [Gracilibacter sp. BRH_c7a]|nr:MAG: DNA polymerase IV [Gracilibacter sp. BRH_c7a]
MNIQPKKRQIIHVDMDAFYASVEQRDNPELQGKPVVVGGNPKGRGVASTCSYEARKYDIRSGMSLAEAQRRCPQAIFLPVNMGKYQEVSAQIHKIFEDYTPLVEPISLDEAFLDVTDSLSLFGSSENIATEIKQRIKKELQLTASVGLASNKYLAKISSDIKKPDGFFKLSDEEIDDFLDPLPVERIWGVGPKTAEQLHRLKVKTISDLKGLDESYLKHIFGSLGSHLYQLARGIDNRPVEPIREIKSIGRETTFPEDIADNDVLKTFILDLAVDVGRRLRIKSLKARTITLKIRYTDFRTVSRSKTLDLYTDLDKDIAKEAWFLLDDLRLTQPVRLLGVSVHNLTNELSQPSLFDAVDKTNMEIISRTVDSLKDRFGEDSITLARLLKDKRKER